MTRSAGTQLVLGLVSGLGNSFWNVVLKASESVLTRAGYGVVLADLRDDPEKNAQFESFIRSGSIAGLILYAPPAGLASRLLATGLPAALLYGSAPAGVRVPSFGLANREAVTELIRHLAGLGHRHIAHLAGPDDNIDGRERLDGYRYGLAVAGIAYDPDLVWPGDFNFVAGTRAAARYFALEHQRRPTAVFAASDEMAIGLISGLRDSGVSVPDMVSVAGFDGTDLSAMYQPALTTVLQPRAEIGRLAAESVLRQLAGGPPETEVARLPCRLVLRQSVVAVPQGATA